LGASAQASRDGLWVVLDHKVQQILDRLAGTMMACPQLEVFDPVVVPDAVLVVDRLERFD
jgi:hypothetical protein